MTGPRKAETALMNCPQVRTLASSEGWTAVAVSGLIDTCRAVLLMPSKAKASCRVG